MIDDFFQKQLSHASSPTKNWGNVIFRIFFYTSLGGFILGVTCGYLHIKGWVPNAETGMVLYAITIGIAALLSTSFVLYQVRQNRLKAEKVKIKSQNNG
jgi:hypothetical protein